MGRHVSLSRSVSSSKTRGVVVQETYKGVGGLIRQSVPNNSGVPLVPLVNPPF